MTLDRRGRGKMKVRDIPKKAKFLSIFLSFSFLLIFIFLLPNAYATTDQALINSLSWSSVPYWSNSTLLNLGLGMVDMLPTDFHLVNSNLSGYLISDIYAFKYSFSFRKEYGGYNNQPDGLWFNNYLVPVGIYFLSGDSGVYGVYNYIHGSAGASFELNYGATYDFSQIILFNNTYSPDPTFTSNIRVYSSGHLEDNNFLLANTSYSFSASDNIIIGTNTLSYLGSSGDSHVLSNQKICLIGSSSPSPTIPSGGIDITQIPNNLALKLGISSFASGIIATIVLLLIVELPLMIFASDNIILMTIFGILILSVGVALTWLPYWTLILIVVMVALLFADVFRKYLTGTH